VLPSTLSRPTPVQRETKSKNSGLAPKFSVLKIILGRPGPALKIWKQSLYSFVAIYTVTHDRSRQPAGQARRRRPVCLVHTVHSRLYDTSSHAFEVPIDTSSHGGRGALAVGVFSSAWGGSFNIYRLVYFTAYCTRHRPSRLG